MASCSGTGSNNSSYQLVLNVNEISTDVSSNTSVVHWELTLNSTGSYSFAQWGSTCTVTINGSTVLNQWSQKSINSYSSITIGSGDITITHDSDGSKSINFSANYTEGSTAYFTAGYISCSGSMGLSTIPRASSVSGGNGNIGENTTININPKSNSFTHTLTYSFENLTGTIVTKTSSTAITWLIPEEFYNAIPNSNSGNGTITCITYNGNTQVGTSTCNFTAKVINSNPIFSDFTYQDTNSNVTDVVGSNQIILKNLSLLKVTISSNNKMIAQNGATCKSYIASIDTISIPIDYSESNVDVNLGSITTSGSKRLNVRAYDSRNNSTLIYKDIEIIDYDSPVINATASRENNFENATTLTLNGTYSKVVVNNVNKNSITTSDIKYRYRETGGTWGSYKTFTSTINTNDGSFTSDNEYISLDNTKSYEIEISVTDKFTTSTEILNVDVGQAIFFVSSNKKACYINGNKILTSDEIYPIGSIYLSVNSTNPSTIFGGTWEQIAKGRTLVGVDTNDSDFNTVKKTGGSKYLQSHTHSMNGAGNHNHTVKFDQVWSTNGGTTSLGTVGGGPYGGNGFVNDAGEHTHTINSAGTGNSGNLQPYFTCYIWCRTA